MKIKFTKHSPLPQQPENYIISNEIWEQDYKIEREELKEYLDDPNDLWLDNMSDSDRVNYKLIKNGDIKIEQSLYLIDVDKIYIYWKDRSNSGKYRQRRGKFEYKNTSYDLPLTDPNFRQFEKQVLKNKFLCISLGEDFNGYCYKLIASIL